MRVTREVIFELTQDIEIPAVAAITDVKEDENTDIKEQFLNESKNYDVLEAVRRILSDS